MLRMSSDSGSERVQNSRFEKGKSCNPAGRPRGSRNKTSLLMEQLLEDQAEQLLKKAIASALEGNTHALRLCLDRLIPRCKDRPIDFEMPRCESYEEICDAVAKIFEAIGSGQITPSEGEKLVNILTFQFQVAVGADLEARLEIIERRLFPNKEEAAFEHKQRMETFEEVSRDIFEKPRTVLEEKTIQDEGANRWTFLGYNGASVAKSVK